MKAKQNLKRQIAAGKRRIRETIGTPACEPIDERVQRLEERVRITAERDGRKVRA